MIGKLAFAAVYTGLTFGANVALAQDVAALEALRSGDMLKLEFAATPEPALLVPFLDEDGAEMTLAAFEGQVVALNFWATWCAPCRTEMPQLSALQTALGGEAFRVVTVATGRNSAVAMERFFADIGVDNLPLYRDPQQALARDFGVLGLPITVILDREGREIARLTGEADWSSESARAIMVALIEG